MGVKKEIEVSGSREKEVEEDGIMMRRVRIGGEEWRIIAVYVNGDMERKLNKLKKWMEGGREEMVMIGGDFDTRTGEQGGRVEYEEEKETGRKSKDKKTNREGWKLLEAVGEVGMKIMNGE